MECMECEIFNLVGNPYYYALKTAHYAGFMLNALPYQLCQKLCWHNGCRPIALHVCQIPARSKYAFLSQSDYCVCVKRRRERIRTKNKNRNFGHSYLGNGFRYLLQLWNVASCFRRALPPQIWCSSDKRSQIYECMNIETLLFLLTPRFLEPHYIPPCVLIP